MTLDDLVRAADPLDPTSLPGPTETDAALRRLLATAPVRPTRRPRRSWIAAATLATAAVTAALVLLLGATASQPAFAITRNHDGTVTIRVKAARLTTADVAAANAQLAKLGVPARLAASAAGALVRCAPAQAMTLVPARLRRPVLISAAGGRLALTPGEARALKFARAAAAHNLLLRPVRPVLATMALHLKAAAVLCGASH